MKMKRTAFLLLLSIQFFSIMYWYVKGNKGLLFVYAHREKNVALVNAVKSLHSEIALLEEELVDWKKNMFSKERIARQELHLAHPTDIVYKVSSKEEKHV